MGMETVLKNLILDHTLGTTTYAKPTLYAALILTNGSEVTGTGYTRKSISFSAAAGSTAATNTVLSWEVYTEVGWGTINKIGLYTASSGGTRLWLSNAFTSTDLTPGGTFTIEIGDADATTA